MGVIALYEKYVKRGIDFLLSLAGLIILSPIFLIISILIRLESKGPALFRQERYGKNRKVFIINKFRTMHIDAPPNLATRSINADKYLTRCGRVLRKTSLDEMPQLINILKGDMSVVGPRPLVTSEKELIEEREKYGANSVRPGLTGLAQINGRDKLGIVEKAKFDGEYVKRMSFLFDLKCFFVTIPYVFFRRGVVEGGHIETG